MASHFRDLGLVTGNHVRLAVGELVFTRYLLLPVANSSPLFLHTHISPTSNVGTNRDHAVHYEVFLVKCGGKWGYMSVPALGWVHSKEMFRFESVD